MPAATHGMYTAKEYRAWISMKTRCGSSNHRAYPDYGGRGIKVCERWLHSFENFYADMGRKPSGLHTLDRKDTNGDYCLENCRWATRREQQNNRRVTTWVIYEGQKISLADAVRKSGIVTRNVARLRLRNGWDLAAALTTPSMTKGSKPLVPA